MFQLRRKRWLSCGRAFCVLGLLTVLFYTLTISKFSDKDHVDQRLMPHQDSIVNQVLSRKVNKRSAYDRQNAIIEDKRPKSHKKNNRKSIYSHRHSNGRDFYFKGYKCVPVLNPQSYLEMTRNTQRTGTFTSIRCLRIIVLFLINRDGLHLTTNIMFSFNKLNESFHILMQVTRRYVMES